jgi:hypothetical protein
MADPYQHSTDSVALIAHNLPGHGVIQYFQRPPIGTHSPFSSSCGECDKQCMEATANTQRRRADRKPAESSVIHVEMNDGMGNPRWVAANLVDVIGGGCGLALMTLLKSGSTVVVRGKLSDRRIAEQIKAGVRWCAAKTDGTYRAGLQFLENRSIFGLDEEPNNSVNPVPLDCYEVMQLSPNADADTVSRVYRKLAFQYHPDNTETGNSEMFLRLCEAHQILSDPAKRASYDIRHRGKNLHQVSPSAGSEWQKRRNLEFVTAAYLGVSLGSTVCWEG